MRNLDYGAICSYRVSKRSMLVVLNDLTSIEGGDTKTNCWDMWSPVDIK